MLYLINCEVVKSYYMGEDVTEEINHIVDATNNIEAKDKVINYYKLKNNPYYVTYWVNFNYINEVIS